MSKPSYYTTREDVITWQAIDGRPGVRRIDLCIEHSDKLSGGWQVHHGLREVTRHWQDHETADPICLHCRNGGAE